MKRPFLFALFILIILALLILLYNNSVPVKFLSSTFQSIFTAPKSLIYSAKSNSKQSSDAKSLRDQNTRLTKQLLEYERIKRDNVALRSQFETASTSQFKLLPSYVIGFEGAVFSPTSLIISQGAKDGIESGMGVLFQNNLVGKIGKVSDNYSQVVLTISSNFKTLAKTSNNAVAGIAAGRGDFIIFDRVLASEDIQTSKTLISAGDINNNGVGIPPDLIIGKIVSVNNSPSLPFQTAKVDPVINFGKLEIVFVIKSL